VIRRALAAACCCQVPIENGWTGETFLEQPAAGWSAADAWRKGATIAAFTAEIFAAADAEVPCKLLPENGVARFRAPHALPAL